MRPARNLRTIQRQDRALSGKDSGRQDLPKQDKPAVLRETQHSHEWSQTGTSTEGSRVVHTAEADGRTGIRRKKRSGRQIWRRQALLRARPCDDALARLPVKSLST